MNVIPCRLLVGLLLAATSGTTLAVVDRTLPPSAAATPSKPDAERTYAFRVNNDGLLVDEQDNPIPVANVAEHIASLGLRGSRMILLLIDGAEAVQKLAPTVHEFEGAFASIVIKERDPGEKTGWTNVPRGRGTPPTGAQPRTVTSVSFPLLGTPPDLSARSPALRPGSIPPGVRYFYVENATLEKATAQLTRHFSTAGRGSNDHWAPSVILHGRAWQMLRPHSQLGTKYPAADERGIVIVNPDDIVVLDAELRRLVADDGGPTVRALTTEEMVQCAGGAMPGIGEPTLVVESAGHHIRLVIGVNPEGFASVEVVTSGQSVAAPAELPPTNPARGSQQAAPTSPSASAAAHITLRAGQTAILVGGQTAHFPPGTTVSMPNGGTVCVQGDYNTIEAGPCAIIAVPLNATGEPTNTASAR